jgi:hypothetical protein
MSNLYDLLSKLQQIEESQPVVEPQQDLGGAGASDESMDSMEQPVEECPDDVTGTVQLSMQDLLKLVSALQGGDHADMSGDQDLMGNDEFDEVYGNEPDERIASVAAVTPTGDDMHSKGDEAEKVNGGGNPLQAQLAELYAQIKERPVVEAKKAKKDYDGDGKVESEKDEVWGSRMKAAKKAGKMESMSLKEANEIARKLRKL